MPPSPLIFVLVLEPLFCRIRANPDRRGRQGEVTHHRAAAYADDLLFFITCPDITIPNLLRELQNHAELSNYKNNVQRSEALNISLPSEALYQIQANFSFTWAQKKIKYLGIYLTPSLSDI